MGQYTLNQQTEVSALVTGTDGLTADPVTPSNPLPVSSSPSTLPPASWAGASFDARAYGSIAIQVNGTPGTAYTPQVSLDNSTWYAATVLDTNLNPITSITAAGIYSYTLGNCYVRVNGGAGSTLLIRGAQ